jgi:hypothetical protein
LALVSAAVGFGLCNVPEHAPGLALCLLLDSCISCTSTVTVYWEEEQATPWGGWLALEELAFSLAFLHPAT